MTFELDMGIDLGTSGTIITIKGKGIVSREPTVAAFDRTTGQLTKVGMAAQRLLGRTPGSIAVLRPLQGGVICDYEVTKRMLREMIRKVSGFTLLKPRILFSVPSCITEVEERAVIEAGMEAGARRVYLIESPVAAALGAGVDVTKPRGHMVVDLGAGTADAAVISASGVATAESRKIGGDAFNDAIISYVRRKYSVLIGYSAAESLKRSVGSVYPRPDGLRMDARGRCLQTGLPKMISINTEDIIEALQGVCGELLESVHRVLETAAPELVGDVTTDGILLTGGGAMMSGMQKLIESSTGIPTRVADSAEMCVAYGLTKALDWLNDMADGTVNLYRRRQLRDLL